MRAYYRMPTSEFVAQLRDIAIKANARPQVIDQLDKIVGAEDIDNEVRDAVEAAENDARKEQWEHCYDAFCDSCEDDVIGLTETQIEQIKTILMDVKP